MPAPSSPAPGGEAAQRQPTTRAKSRKKKPKAQQRAKNLKTVLHIRTPVMNQLFGIIKIASSHNVYAQIEDDYQRLGAQFPREHVRVTLIARAKRRATQQNLDRAVAEFNRRIQSIQVRLNNPLPGDFRGPRPPIAGLHRPVGSRHSGALPRATDPACRKPSSSRSIRLVHSPSGSLVVKRTAPARAAKRRALLG